MRIVRYFFEVKSLLLNGGFMINKYSPDFKKQNQMFGVLGIMKHSFFFQSGINRSRKRESNNVK